MRISVAMCTHNGAPYLRDQLDSVARQDRSPDELIICDDHSTDNTVRIVEQYSREARFPVTIIRNKELLGTVKNFEQAIGLCVGDIIAVSDQDDIWGENKLRRIEEAFGENPCVDLFFSDGEVVDENLKPLNHTMWESFKFTKHCQKEFHRGRAFEYLVQNNVVAGCTMAFRAECRRLVLPIPMTWIEIATNGLLHDWWIALLISATSSVGIIPECLIKYRKHSGQQIGAAAPLSTFRTRRNMGTVVKEGVSRHTDFSEYLKMLSVVYERLLSAERVNQCHKRDAIKSLELRISHFNSRSALPRSLSRKLPVVMRELCTLRYHNYSKGFRSFAKDLLV